MTRSSSYLLICFFLLISWTYANYAIGTGYPALLAIDYDFNNKSFPEWLHASVGAGTSFYYNELPIEQGYRFHKGTLKNSTIGIYQKPLLTWPGPNFSNANELGLALGGYVSQQADSFELHIHLGYASYWIPIAGEYYRQDGYPDFAFRLFYRWGVL